jgi:hypothetical protein
VGLYIIQQAFSTSNAAVIGGESPLKLPESKKRKVAPPEPINIAQNEALSVPNFGLSYDDEDEDEYGYQDAFLGLPDAMRGKTAAKGTGYGGQGAEDVSDFVRIPRVLCTDWYSSAQARKPLKKLKVLEMPERQNCSNKSEYTYLI